MQEYKMRIDDDEVVSIVPLFNLPESKYCVPVGERWQSQDVWPEGWGSALGWAMPYWLGIHTGDDLNWNKPWYDRDRHTPVFAIADGEAYAVRKNVSGWDTVICIRHEECLSRYAHLTEETINVVQGWTVKKGQFLGSIGNAKGAYAYHLHFDIAKLDSRMARYPLDWPGKAPDAMERVLRDYYSPVEFLKVRV